MCSRVHDAPEAGMGENWVEIPIFADGYDFEATVCQDGVVFQNVKWNEEATKVEVYREFNKNPLGIVEATTGSLIGKMTYDATSPEAVVAVWRSTGTPWRVPTDVAATGATAIVDYAQVVKDAGQSPETRERLRITSCSPPISAVPTPLGTAWGWVKTGLKSLYSIDDDELFVGFDEGKALGFEREEIFHGRGSFPNFWAARSRIKAIGGRSQSA